MNQDQKNRVSTQLVRYRELNLNKRIAEVYKDQNNLSEVFLGYYFATEFSEYSNKCIDQFDSVIGSPFSTILPFQYQFNNDFGNGNLVDDLGNFNANIEANNFSEASNFLVRLIYYQVVHGFWNTVLETDDKAKFANIGDMERKMALISEQLAQSIKSNSELTQSLKEEKEALEQLVNVKTKELNEIEALLPSSRNNTEEINKLLNSSTATNEAINSLLVQQKANLDDITKKMEEERGMFSSIQKEFREAKDAYGAETLVTKKYNQEFDKMLATVIDKSSTFEARIGVLNELIGKEGAVRLFQTFNDRKKDLEAPVNRWANTVFATGCIALFLIIGIFTNFFGKAGDMPTTIDWQYLLINSIKSMPVMIVLLFTIKQYVRERTFQEEYAFRSAIALTVQAYGDIAGTKKEELIIAAVSTIYSLPSMMKEKSYSLFGYRSKALTETMKEVNETLKLIKP